MKKRTWFILGLALILIISGGIGSIVYFQRLETQRAKSAVNQKFKYDHSEELVLNIKNSASLHLSTSEDDYVHMTKQGLAYETSNEDKTTWDIQKEGNQTIISIDNKNSKQSMQPSFFNFGDIYDDSISLSLPENYKKITIKGNNLDINMYELVLKKLDIKTKHGYVNANNLTSEELSIDSTYGDISLHNTKVENNIALNSSNGSIYIQDTSFTDLSASMKNGDIFTGNTKGNLAITNHSGDTSINHTKGKVTVDNKNGDITLHSNSVNYDVLLNTIHGNVLLEIDKPSYSKNKFDLETQFGSISIFNKNLSPDTNFKSDKGLNTIKVASKNGDITINELDEDDTEYDMH